ncbi:hypothetical protein, partial [Trichormus variabilis]|uniref:hypothetical protein n=1 Tax=Anabaena variabilis TaxID=264691 RepID=UPI001A92A480
LLGCQFFNFSHEDLRTDRKMAVCISYLAKILPVFINPQRDFVNPWLNFVMIGFILNAEVR